MKRSSFLKTLIGIAIAPVAAAKVLGEVKEKGGGKYYWECRQYPMTPEECVNVFQSTGVLVTEDKMVIEFLKNHPKCIKK